MSGENGSEDTGAREFGRRLEAWRVARGLTRRQAGKLLGVQVRTMDTWRRGDHKPQGALLAVIERAMDETTAVEPAAMEAKP